MAGGYAYRQFAHWRVFAAAILAIGLLGASPQAGQAEPCTVIVLPASRGGPELASSLEGLLASTLSERDFDLVEGFTLARAALGSGAVPEADLVPFRQAEQLLEEGWRSYLEVRASFAAARLAEARTTALRVAHLDGGRALVAEVSLRLGVVKMDLGRGAEAADDFRLSHILAPERAVTDAEFKPEAVTSYRAALAAPSLVHSRELPSQVGLRLWIDGSEVFGSQVRLSEGLHMLEARQEGFFARTKLVSVSPGQATPLSIELEPDATAKRVLAGRDGLALGRAESEARQVASAMFLYSQTNELLLVSSVWRRGAPALLGQRCSGMPARCSAVVEIGYPAGGVRVAAAELWRTLERAARKFPPTLQVDTRVVSSEGKPGAVATTSGTPLWKNRWVWLGVAATAVAGSAVYLLAEPDLGKAIFVGERCDFGGCP